MSAAAQLKKALPVRQTVDFLAHGVDLRQQLHGLFGQGAQLFRCHLVEIGRGSHAADCVRAGRQQR